jgi:hypothetical protein
LDDDGGGGAEGDAEDEEATSIAAASAAAAARGTEGIPPVFAGGGSVRAAVAWLAGRAVVAAVACGFAGLLLGCDRGRGGGRGRGRRELFEVGIG